MSEIFHYCGHIISSDELGRFPQSNEAKVQQALDSYFKQLEIMSCYGSLASGSDILLAEAMLKKGANLHVVLPFDKNDFIDLSVTSSGAQWEQRFAFLISQATSITQVFYQKPEDKNLSFALCTEIAMGLGLLEATEKHELFPLIAKQFPLKPEQITVWDQQKTSDPAGTYPDMLRWSVLGLESTYISSKSPIEINQFKDKNKDGIQPLDLVIYNESDSGKNTPIRTIEALITKLNNHPLNIDGVIDLNRDVFGQIDTTDKSVITNRALGHVVFHCYAKRDFFNRTLFLSSLLKMRNLKYEQDNPR